jgi:hypothetical protein
MDRASWKAATDIETVIRRARGRLAYNRRRQAAARRRREDLLWRYRDGVAGFETVEQLANACGVSRTTIYRDRVILGKRYSFCRPKPRKKKEVEGVHEAEAH